jgi:hypothetical protein
MGFSEIASGGRLAEPARPEYHCAVVLQNVAPKKPVLRLDFLNGPGQARARHFTKYFLHCFQWHARPARAFQNRWERCACAVRAAFSRAKRVVTQIAGRPLADFYEHLKPDRARKSAIGNRKS